MTALADRTINLLVRDRTRFGVGAIDDLDLGDLDE